MKRYFFEISYDGAAFNGWQIQPKEVSVQQTLETVLTKLNRLTPVSIVGCGRTDTGVHASSYIFHTDLDESIFPELQYKMNKMLPATIAVHQIWEVEAEMHARFSATKRMYHYFIHSQKNPFKHNYSTYYPHELDVDAMNEASKCLYGTHDFTTFSKLNSDVKTYICTVFEAKWYKVDGGYRFEYQANRFLRNMVRATVGTLLDVGTGKITPQQFEEIFKSLDRKKCAGSAPAQGLFLSNVEY